MKAEKREMVQYWVGQPPRKRFDVQEMWSQLPHQLKTQLVIATTLLLSVVAGVLAANLVYSWM